MQLLVKGGHIVDPANSWNKPGDMLVADGRILEVGENLSSAGGAVFDATGLLVMPGLVDLHTHFGEPGHEERETLESGTMAAARGGFTTVLLMPDTDPPLDTPALITQVKAEAAQRAHARVCVAGALTKGLAGKEMSEMAGLTGAGAMALVQPDGSVENLGLLRRILQYSRDLGALVVIKPYDISLQGDGLMHEGVDSTVFGLRGIPALAEEVGVATAIMLAQETNAALHLTGVSTARSMELLKDAKGKGVRISCDVSPHHLTLTSAALGGYEPACKLLPPLRPASDVAALVAGLQSGVIDCIATHHRPFQVEEKEVELSIAPWGVVGLETAFAQVYTALVASGMLSIDKLVAAFSTQPAALLGIKDAGALTPGNPADFVLVDPQAQRQVEPAQFLSKGKSTPVKGQSLVGWPIATYLAGSRAWPEAKM